MASTTLAGAISAVPTLGSKCSLALNTDAPGSGLKAMRLVSKQMRAAMLDSITGYTLRLDGNAHSLMNEMGLLQGCKLSCLRVVVLDNADGIFPGGLNGWGAHTQHLRCFLSGMGPAIRNITRLELQSECKDVEGVTELLSLLAPACQALQRLKLSGNIRRGLLAAVGVSCKALTFLEVARDMKADTLEQLHMVLPTITHCKVSSSLVETAYDSTIAGPCCLSLMSCTSITSLDVGARTLTPNMWRSLPHGLRNLSCLLPRVPDVGLSALLHLKHLTCYVAADSYAGVHLCSLLAVLCVAPELTSLRLSERESTLHTRPMRYLYVCVRCNPASIADLIYYHKRLSAGLSIDASFIRGEVSKQVALRLLDSDNSSDLDEDDFLDEDDVEESQQFSIAAYLATLPPFPAFTSLVMWGIFKINSVASVSAGIAAVFPKLTSLVLDLCEPTNSSDLIHLGIHTCLQQLTLDESNVTPISLAMLCNRLPSLRVINCRDLNPGDGQSLQSLLRLWGFDVKVSVK